jgi:hypothetical protein
MRCAQAGSLAGAEVDMLDVADSVPDAAAGAAASVTKPDTLSFTALAPSASF